MLAIILTTIATLLMAFERKHFLAFSDACAPCSCTGGSVNCSYRHLQQVPNNLPPGALSLDLSHNLLHYLPDNVFQRLTNLTVLDLSYNCLTNLTPSVFVGLCSLQWLSLSWNNISLSDETYPEGVFSPFNTTLLHLYLNGNSPPNTTLTLNVSYPDKALSQLSNLTTLFMDGLNDTRFGVGLEYLNSLKNLSLVGFENGFCDLVTLHNDTFTHHPPALQYLNLSYCNIRYIEADAFKPLRTLQILDLSHNEYLGFQRLGLAMHGLQGSKLHSLHVNYINPHNAACVIVSNADTVYFKNTSIKTIYAKHNSVQVFSQGALLNMPDTLEFVSLNGNHLALGSYFQDFIKLKGLKKIHADGYTQLRKTPTQYPADGSHVSVRWNAGTGDDSVSFFGAGDADNYNRCFQSVTTACGTLLREHSDREEAKGVEPYIPTNFVLPPNLTDFRSRRNQIYYQLSQINFDPTNTLMSADLSQNLISEMTGPVSGLNSLHHLDLSDNLAYHISDVFFSNFPSLKILLLSKNNLRNVIGNHSSGLFTSLVHLEALDLSDNYVYLLSKNLLKGLVSLRMLNLSFNEITSFDVDLSAAKNLRVLDLAYNNIQSLPQDVRDHLDSIAHVAVPENITVNLTGNHIICACQNIDFLSWMENTQVYFPRVSAYFCLMSDGTAKMYINIFEEIANLQKECSSFVGITVGAVCCCLCLVLALVSALVYRFRWKLRYLYYASRMSYRRTQSEHRQFLFDAFVSYATEDKNFVHGQLVHTLEQQEHLRLHVRHRDFTPDKPTACNIMAAIENSHRTLVVLTRRLLQSDWCQYEMQMATMEAVHTGRDVLLFLLYEDIPSHELPRQVLYNLQSSTYIQFPHDDPSLLFDFWSRLACAIKV